MVSIEVSGGDGIILGVVGDVSLVTAISVIRFQALSWEPMEDIELMEEGAGRENWRER